ncbi:MAG: pyridoxamine 5'-phosphate oxidase family protein [Syntrophomonadaceae bacterium]|nr:pyridoxamine 5'-phosphate oxidase family protein [Syntrophomonadaceae bacterium]MDD3023438.1 pyridoxamine 5'-phosphate oxidase family protein [Syntrophomonadaceae bacterium]
MKKEELFALMNSNPAFHLATVEDDQPRVRGMLLYRADENGIIFHTGTMKDVYKQIVKNPKVELCFNDFKNGVQLRVSGSLEIVDDRVLKEEITAHPTRLFLKGWKEDGSMPDFYNELAVFRLCNGTANTWTMDRNFAPKENIIL